MNKGHEMSERLLDVNELSKVINVKPQWIYRAARSGIIPCRRFGKQVRFDLDEVLEASNRAFIQSRDDDAGGEPARAEAS